jgi:hypothetical protein
MVGWFTQLSQLNRARAPAGLGRTNGYIESVALAIDDGVRLVRTESEVPGGYRLCRVTFYPATQRLHITLAYVSANSPLLEGDSDALWSSNSP